MTLRSHAIENSPLKTLDELMDTIFSPAGSASQKDNRHFTHRTYSIAPEAGQMAQKGECISLHWQAETSHVHCATDAALGYVL